MSFFFKGGVMKVTAKTLLASLLFFFFVPVYSNLVPELIVPSSLATTNGLTSSVVNGCVSVISGDYVENYADIVIPGVEPILITRSYCSGDNSQGVYLRSWRMGYPTLLSYEDNDCDIPNNRIKLKAHVAEEFGGTLSYENVFITKKEPAVMTLPLKLRKGLTNCAGGEVSAKTNPKQTVAILTRVPKKRSDEWLRLQYINVKNGANDFRTYKHVVVNTNTFLLDTNKKANGCLLDFSYGFNYFIKRISSKDRSGKETGWVEYQWPLGLEQYITAKASNGRNYQFNFVTKTMYFDKNGTPSKQALSYLTNVEGTDAPYEKFFYSKKAKDHFLHISHKERHDHKKPKSDYKNIGIKYYTTGLATEIPEQVYIKESTDWKIDRVEAIQQPVGKDSTLYPTFRFVYDSNSFGIKENGKGYEVLQGTTRVYDAYLCKTEYKYDQEHRLTKIKKFTGRSLAAYNHAYSERFMWGAKGSQDEGNLYCKYLEDAEDKIYRSQTFTYDPKGNILETSIFGNITGTGQETFVKENHKGVDCQTTTYKYSNDDFNLLKEEQDANGKKITYDYIPGSNLLVAQTIWDGKANQILQKVSFEYDVGGNLIKKVLEDGVGTEKHITKITPRKEFPVGQPDTVEEYYFDKEKNREVLLHKHVNFYTNGYITRQDHYDADNSKRYSLYWVYDEKGNLLKETNALGEIITREYDVNKNLVMEKGPRDDFWTTYEYDYMNRLTKVITHFTNAPNQEVSHEYDFRNQRIATTDIHGNKTTFTYDDLGRMVRQEGPTVPDENGVCKEIKIETKYDIFGNPTEVTDAKGNVTRTAYNIFGKPLKITYPDNTVEYFQYDLMGNLTQKIAKNGLITTFSYDCLGRVLETIEKSSSGEILSVVTSTYNGFHMTSTTDGNGNATYFTYDGAGRESTITKGNSKTTLEYDNLGRVFKRIEWADQNDAVVNLFLYDNLNRVIEERTETIAGKILTKTNYQYDKQGNRTDVITTTDLGNSVAHTVFDPLKRPTETTDALGNTTHFVYNDNFTDNNKLNVTQTLMTDPLGLVTITTNDTLDRVARVEKRNPFGETLSLKENRYDLANNLCMTIEYVYEENAFTKQIVTYWEYNTVNQVTKCVEAVGTPEQKQSISIYNTLGQLQSLVKPDGTTIEYAYDDKGRLSTFRDSNETFCYAYGYDKNNNPTQIDDIKSHLSTTREYDSNNRMKREVLSNGLTMQYEYDGLNRITKIVFPDQSYVVNQYESAQLKKISKYNSNGTLVYAHEYTKYDSRGLLSNSKLIGQSGEIATSYDLMGRLKQNRFQDFAEAVPDNGYDQIGNLLKIERNDPQGNINASFAYSDLYQLKSETGHVNHQFAHDSTYNRTAKDENRYTLNYLNQIISDGYSQYNYDANGNVIKKENAKEVWSYQYDGLDRLVAVSKGNTTIKYTYDSFNRRMTKTTQNNTQSYLYQDQNEIGVIENGKMIALRILGIGKGAEIGASVAIELQNKIYAPLHDYRGNIYCLLDASTGQIAETYRYSAFGEETIFNPSGQSLTTSAINNPWRFSSKHADEETGLIYFGRRYYDPALGRWLTPDPLGLTAGPNLYAYVMNSPLIHFDLYGLFDDDFFSFSGETAFLMTSNIRAMGDEDARFAMKGMAHGAMDFAYGTMQGLHTSAFLFGSSDFDLGDRLQLYDIHRNQQRKQKAAFDDAIMDFMNVEKNNPTYQAFRSCTELTLEVGSIATAGYGIAKGVMNLNKFAKTSTKISEAIKFNTNACSIWPSPSQGGSVVNGIEYTTHSLERMAPRGLIQKGTEMISRGVPPSVVENAINFGTKTMGNTSQEVVHIYENVRVVTNKEATKVITVITTGR